MNLCGSAEAGRINRIFCAAFLQEPCGRGIAFCHTRVTFYFGLRLTREERNLAVRSRLSPLACLFCSSCPQLLFFQMQRDKALDNPNKPLGVLLLAAAAKCPCSYPGLVTDAVRNSHHFLMLAPCRTCSYL